MARVKNIEKVEKKEVIKADPKKEVKKIELKPESRRKLRWKKMGGGSLRGIPGYPIVKPGQEFEAYLDDISPRFLTSLKCLDSELLAEQVGKRETPAPKEILYTASQNKKVKDAWDVLKPDGTPINDISMTKDEAEKLAIALNN
jgi:hypothetical protein